MAQPSFSFLCWHVCGGWFLPQNKLSHDYGQSHHLRELGATETVSAVWGKLFYSCVLDLDTLKFDVESLKFDSYFLVFQMLSASACSVKALVL